MVSTYNQRFCLAFQQQRTTNTSDLHAPLSHNKQPNFIKFPSISHANHQPRDHQTPKTNTKSIAFAHTFSLIFLFCPANLKIDLSLIHSSTKRPWWHQHASLAPCPICPPGGARFGLPRRWLRGLGALAAAQGGAAVPKLRSGPRLGEPWETWDVDSATYWGNVTINWWNFTMNCGNVILIIINWGNVTFNWGTSE